MLKKLMLMTTLAVGLTTVAHAKDEAHYLDFNQAVQNAISQGLIDGKVKFNLAGTRSGGQVIKKNVISNKKTNGFAKSAEKSCEHALHSALIHLDAAAKKQGATSVNNIVGYFKKIEYRSTSKYQCYKGTAIASVTLKGDLVR